MRIAYVLPHGWRFAGWSLDDMLRRYHFSKHLGALMSRRGHEVELLVLHEDVDAPMVLQTEPFRIEAFPISARLPFLRFGGDVSGPLLRRLRGIQADVVHIHGCFYEMLPWISRASPSHTVLQWHGGRVPPLHGPLFRGAYRRAARILIPFDAARDSFPGGVTGATPFEVVPLPLRPEVLAAPPKTAYRGTASKLLYVGRVARPRGNLWERRLDVLLRILGNLGSSAPILDVIGEGPGMQECIEIARDVGLGDRVQFHGYQDLQQILGFYREADLTVAPFFLTDLTGTWVAQLQESLAMGTPVLGFHPGGGFAEHELGWRIPADPARGASELASVLADAAALESKGRRGPGVVRTRSSEEQVGSQLERLYETIRV